MTERRRKLSQENLRDYNTNKLTQSLRDARLEKERAEATKSKSEVKISKPSSTPKLKATPTNDKILIDFDFNEFKRGMKDTRRRLKKEIELYDRLDQERKRLEDLEKLRQNLRKIEKARIARKEAILGAVGLAGAGLLGYEALKNNINH